MRVLVGINRICYGACLLAIISGAFLAVFAIWTEQHDVGWKGVATAGVLIFAAILVLATNGVIGSKVMEEGGGIADFTPGRSDAMPGRAALASKLAEKRRGHGEGSEGIRDASDGTP